MRKNLLFIISCYLNKFMCNMLKYYYEIYCYGNIILYKILLKIV